MRKRRVLTATMFLIIALIAYYTISTLLVRDIDQYVKSIVEKQYHTAYTYTGQSFKEAHTQDVHNTFFDTLAFVFGEIKSYERVDSDSDQSQIGSDQVELVTTYKLHYENQPLTLKISTAPQPKDMKISKVEVYDQEGNYIPMYLTRDEPYIYNRTRAYIRLIQEGKFDALFEQTTDVLAETNETYLEQYFLGHMQQAGDRIRAYDVKSINASTDENAYVIIEANPNTDYSYELHLMLHRKDDYKLAAAKFVYEERELPTRLRIDDQVILNSESLGNQFMDLLKLQQMPESESWIDLTGRTDDRASQQFLERTKELLGIQVDTYSCVVMTPDSSEEVVKLIYRVKNGEDQLFLTIFVDVRDPENLKVFGLAPDKPTYFDNEQIELSSSFSHKYWIEKGSEFTKAFITKDFDQAFQTLEGIGHFNSPSQLESYAALIEETFGAFTGDFKWLQTRPVTFIGTYDIRFKVIIETEAGPDSVELILFAEADTGVLRDMAILKPHTEAQYLGQ